MDCNRHPAVAVGFATVLLRRHSILAIFSLDRNAFSIVSQHYHNDIIKDRPKDFSSSVLPRGKRLADKSLFGNLAHRDAQRFGNTLTVSRIGFQAAADMAYLDLLRRVSHGASRVLKESLLLLRAHHSE